MSVLCVTEDTKRIAEQEIRASVLVIFAWNHRMLRRFISLFFDISHLYPHFELCFKIRLSLKIFET